MFATPGSLRNNAADATDDALIWATRNGTPYSRNNLSRRVLTPAGEAAGLPWVGWHTLRHTCASILFRRGANAKQVQAWLGHHSPGFTLATYVHILPEDAPDPGFWDALTAPRGGNQVGTSPAEMGLDREVAAGADSA